MNAGRIEQIDAPYLLYTRPRTRFVAGFIGRTNLVSGRCNGETVVFDRFTLPRRLFGEQGRALAGEPLFSIRPQSITLHRSAETVRERACVVEARLEQRTFLGETWDYIVVPAESRLRLKIAAPPFKVFEVGEKVWLEFDPLQMAPVTE
ncbi:MAG: TOBE domain-containing protein [Acetobacteraceae bacterium]